MEVPIVAPAPVVIPHAVVCRDLFDNHGPCWHFQHSLTGLIVLPKKSLAHRARGILDSADNTNVSCFRSGAPWRADMGNQRRIGCMLQETQPQRRRPRDALGVFEDSLCAHVGTLSDHGDRHDNHGDGTYLLAHHPITSFSVSGPVRCPWERRLDRRDEALTQGEAAVAQHVPDLQIPTDNKGRHRLPRQVDPVWLQDLECRAWHEPFRTTMALALDVVEAAIRHKVPLGVVVFAAWSLAEDWVRVLARRRQDGISLRKQNRRLQTARLHRWDAHGWTRKLPSPHLAVEHLVPLIPATAYRPITIRESKYWCVTLGLRIPRSRQGPDREQF